MRTDNKRRLVQAAIAIAGVVAILASGGGGGSGPSCAFIIPDVRCPGDYVPPPPPPPPQPPQPSVSLAPAGQVVQVGMPASFQATTANLSNPTYSWCRTPASGGECTPLPGIHESTYTIASVNMPDDAAQFRVTATGTQGTATSGFSMLHVSSMAAVVFEDGEFLEPDWTVTSTGSDSALTFTGSRTATGGNPGAFLNETYNIPATVGQSLVLHGKLSANYDPTSQGAIYLLEFSMECRTTTPLTWVTFAPMFEQSGRRFATENPGRFGTGFYCTGTPWYTTRWGPMSSGWFYRVSGPECGSGESCPDFSASAPPLRFGFMVIERSISPGAAQPITYGYDNWKMTVWRK